MTAAMNAAELAAAVLGRTWPGARDPAWRGRADDEAVLLIEVCRWLEGCHRQDGPTPAPPPALSNLFAELARRRAPLAAVRRWVEQVLAQAHRELGSPPRHAGALLAALEQAYP
jgi:hypothetical protein